MVCNVISVFRKVADNWIQTKFPRLISYLSAIFDDFAVQITDRTSAKSKKYKQNKKSGRFRKESHPPAKNIKNSIKT